MAKKSKKSGSSAVLWVFIVILALATALVIFDYSMSKTDVVEDGGFAAAYAAAVDKRPGNLSEEDFAKYETMSVQPNAYMYALYQSFGIDPEANGIPREGYSVFLTLPGYDDAITVPAEDATEEEKKAYDANLELVVSVNAPSFDYADLARFTGLKNISVYYDEEFSDLSVLANAAALEGIDVYACSVADISALSSMKGLKTLAIVGNEVADIAPVKELTALTLLDFSDNNITDISAISGLTALETLGLSGNEIADITPIKGLTAIKSLDLSDTGVKDFDTILALPALESVNLANNEITDASALAALNSEGFKSLNLSGNTITDWTAFDSFKEKVTGYPAEEENAEEETEEENAEETEETEETEENTEAEPEAEQAPEEGTENGEAAETETTEE